jgi:hypothetical protein
VGGLARVGLLGLFYTSRGMVAAKLRLTPSREVRKLAVCVIRVRSLPLVGMGSFWISATPSCDFAVT